MICRKYSGLSVGGTALAEFITIYIAEAHPTDGWYLFSDVPMAQAKTMEDRCDAAALLRESKNLRIPLFCDGIENNAMSAFSAWPERLYVVRLHLDEPENVPTVVFKGGIGPEGYSVEVIFLLLVSC